MVELLLSESDVVGLAVALGDIEELGAAVCVSLLLRLRVMLADTLRVRESEIVGVIVAVILLDVPGDRVSVLDAVRGGDDVAESDPVSDTEHDDDAD